MSTKHMNYKSRNKLFYDDLKKRKKLLVKTLKPCSQEGKKVTKVHRVVCFRDKLWLEEYLEQKQNRILYKN